MSDYGEIIEPATIRFERVLPGPIERVWEFLTDSEKRGLWLASGAMEPRVGGKLTLAYDNNDLSPDKTPPAEKYQGRGRATSQHTITRFEPPRFLGMTWGDPNDPSEVNFELTPEGDRVRLVLVHRRLPRATMLNVGPGWHTHLNILGDQLGGRSPRAFWTVFGEVSEYYEKRVAAQTNPRG